MNLKRFEKRKNGKQYDGLNVGIGQISFSFQADMRITAYLKKREERVDIYYDPEVKSILIVPEKDGHWKWTDSISAHLFRVMPTGRYYFKRWTNIGGKEGWLFEQQTTPV